MATVIDRDQLQDLVAQGALLVEVLKAEEYQEDHLPGALSIPLAQIDRETVKTLDQEHPIFHYHAGKLDWMAAGLPTEGENAKRPRAGTVARKDVPVCALTDRVGQVRDRARAAGWDAAVAVNDDHVVLGLLRSAELDKDADQPIEEAMRPGPSTFRPYVPIKEMADYMTQHKLESSPVTTSDGKLVGLLLRSDAVAQAEGCPDCVRKMI
ncbi:MAG: CBS domain-containing protein [Chloroflexi bacterium]|nr:MAG: CBS domain-containing protein [Chloroflexota bacterium]